MSKIIYDSDILSAMTESLIEYDKNGNILEYMSMCEHLDGIAVADLLEAQRDAIKGGSGGGSEPVSGGTMDITPESQNMYSEWDNIIEGNTNVVPNIGV